MEQSDSIQALAAALIKAKAAFEPLTPDKVNPHFKSKYASLDQCFKITEKALAENGLVVVQMPENAPDAMVGMTTMLMHTSGEYVRSARCLPMQGQGPQAAGSAESYARRYGYCAVLGLAVDEDDDGEAAQHQGGTTVAAGTDLLERKRKQYFAKSRELGREPSAAKELLKDNFHLESFNDATLEQLTIACNELDKIKKQREAEHG